MSRSKNRKVESTDLLLGRARESLKAGQRQAAFEDFTRAIEREVGCAAAWQGRGEVLLKQGEFAHAGAQFQQALRLDAKHDAAHFNLAQALFQFGLIEQALEHLDQIAGRTGGESELLAAIYAPGSASVAPQEILARRRAFAVGLPQRAPLEVEPPISSGPLRVGYLSAHFDRPNYMKPVWGLVNQHDRRALELFFFSDAPEAPEAAGYAPHPADRWFDVRALDNSALAATIRAQRLDVLVDLNAYSYVRRLPLWSARIAPVNVAWFNMYATSGLPGIQCLIGDRHVFDGSESDQYSEQVISLSHSYLTFRVLYDAPEIATSDRSAPVRLTLGCLAPMYKISDAVLAAWAEILRRAPHARLLLRNGMLDGASNRQFVESRLASAGLPLDRIEFRGSAPHHEFLRTYDDVDLALDTFPYNGGSTTMEALWQGVPVACFRGDRWAARISASLSAAAGLDEFIADSPQSHIEQVVGWLSDPRTPERLAEYRRGMRARLLTSSVCDTAGMARELEAVYRQIVVDRNPRRDFSHTS